MKLHMWKKNKKSIFHTIFVPLIFVMIFQAAIYYISAVYGGVEKSLNQNAADILSERMTNRKNEIETMFNKDWTKLDYCEKTLTQLYCQYQEKMGDAPFKDNKKAQINFIRDASDTLINTLRSNQVNGIFLMLNSEDSKLSSNSGESFNIYGCDIRDMDSTSAYTDREDLLLERMPSSIVDETGCSLDSWWEATYSFSSEDEAPYYFNPLNAAWDNQGVDGEDLAYFQSSHRISDSDQEVVSYSIPLFDNDGKPYGVLGVEITTKYLASLIPNKELGEPDKTGYVLAIKNVNDDECIPITASGSMYTRWFPKNMGVKCSDSNETGGFSVTGNDDEQLYGIYGKLNIYNNNNPFEDDELVLVALIDEPTLFYYSTNVKHNLFIVASFSLLLGVLCIFVVSHLFAHPITSLAKKARHMEPKKEVHLPRLGIAEIDQLVDSIETLNKNVSKETARIEFFSRMSHDMRTPMNAIISFSSSEMLDGADEVKKDDYLKKIHLSGEYLLGLINEVLDMTKIENGKVDLNYETVKAESILDTVVPMVDKLADKKKINFVKRINVPQNLFIITDMQHLNQIILNILSNAVKFTKEDGNVELDMEISHITNGKAACEIIVKDNGIGMSKEFMEKLYQPFEQENEGKGGTGLGLSICRKLIEIMGGTIECQSEKGKGTEFKVYIEFEKDNTIQVQQNNEDEITISNEEIDNILKGRHILLCEDQPINTQIAQVILQRKGMIVDTAQNGQIGADTFEKSEEGYYDAVLMDIRMPVLDGLGATRLIRAMERSDAKRVPIIAMTANAFAEDMEHSRQAGMNAHLSKPIEPAKLYMTLALNIRR